MDVQENFCRSIDPSRLRISRIPSLIFLCGGKKSEVFGKYKSARDYLGCTLKARYPEIAQKVVLAEDLVDWFKAGIYKDLLSLERDLADLCSSILLFVESPGSIAELGAFTMIPSIRNKLLVVLRADHKKGDSFISLGPVRLLENEIPDCVYTYHWEMEGVYPNEYLNVESFSEDCKELIDVLEEKLDKSSKTQAFNSKIAGHKALLVRELIYVLGPIKIMELKRAFEIIVGDTEFGEFKKLTQICLDLDMIGLFEIGNDKYYACLDENRYIDFSYKNPSSSNETSTWRIHIRGIMRAKDQRRLRVLSLSRSNSAVAEVS